MRLNEAKQAAVLEFLSIETFSTPVVLSCFLGLSVATTRRLCLAMEKDGLLLREKHFIEGRANDVFGITQKGLVVGNIEPDGALFELERIKSQFITHRLECQRVGIWCMKNGYKFLFESQIRNNSYKKLPDGLWFHQEFGKIAVEIELEVKSKKRLSEIFPRYLSQMEGDGHFDMVLYLVPKKMLAGTVRLFQSIPVDRAPSRDGLPEKRQYRFAVGSLENFPRGVEYLWSEYPLYLYLSTEGLE